MLAFHSSFILFSLAWRHGARGIATGKFRDAAPNSLTLTRLSSITRDRIERDGIAIRWDKIISAPIVAALCAPYETVSIVIVYMDVFFGITKNCAARENNKRRITQSLQF